MKIFSLKCTKKLYDLLHGVDNDLKVRDLRPTERQLLILMTANSQFTLEDDCCKQNHNNICDKLLGKVNLEGLISRGYIACLDAQEKALIVKEV